MNNAFGCKKFVCFWLCHKHYQLVDSNCYLKKHINELDLAKYIYESKNGLIMEIDLEYPKKLHNMHNDYPLAPKQVCVEQEMLLNSIH